MDYQKKYEFWLANAKDQTVKEQLLAMQNDEKAKENAFYQDLEFGTAGLRGVMGAGTNCMNIYTVGKATQGLADFMNANGKKIACVTCDSRLNSILYMETVTRVMAKNGIKCYLTAECQPTPFLSYIVRELHADIGVNITASHNPQQYNGYKVYDSFGCQLTDNDANAVTSFIEKVNPFTIELDTLENYIKQGLACYTHKDLEQQFLNRVLQENLNCASGISVTYTPLNGTGYKMVPEILRSICVSKIDVVPEQAMPDGHFATCSYPNPEKKEALSLALALAEEKQSDIVIGTDPDCDRIGVAVRHNGEYIQLTGNEVGVLLADYVLASRQAKKQIHSDLVVVKTIVSSALTNKLADSYGVKTVDVLTGFKYIGDVIKKLEDKGQEDNFVFGFEESCGYLKGTYVRDKDAVVASMLVAEMAAILKHQGKTLVDKLNEFYAKYGTYKHLTTSYEFSGASGATVKQQLLDSIRSNGIDNIGGKKVVSKTDYLTQTEYDLPKADVMKFVAEDGTTLIVRPSGTEPLIKNYITVCCTPEENAVAIKNITEQLDKIYKV